MREHVSAAAAKRAKEQGRRKEAEMKLILCEGDREYKAAGCLVEESELPAAAVPFALHLARRRARLATQNSRQTLDLRGETRHKQALAFFFVVTFNC